MKTSQDYLEEANAVVRRISAKEAIEIHKGGEAVFVDVRDSKSLANTGTIEGAHHIARGMIELSADPASPYHRDVLDPGKQICLVCGGGLMAAMAGKTLQEMGFQNVVNIGGIQEWKDAGGPTEEV